MRRPLAVLALLVQGFAVGCVSMAHDPRWVVVKSPRFEIYSTFAAEDSKTLAEELERFHALIYAMTNAPHGESVVPTRIFAFAQRTQYLELAPADSAGFFMPGLRQNMMLTSPRARRLGISQVVLHEYVHHVLRNGSEQTAPIWYDEGMAEFFSTVRLQGTSLAVGKIPKTAAAWLQRGEWLSLDRVISTRAYEELSSNELGMFYAEAWALVHYLTFDREPGSTSISQGMRQYLDFIALGSEPADAFATAFGESTLEAGQSIRKTLSTGIRVIGYPIAALDYDDSEPKVRPPGSGEIALRLGELHLARQELAQAEIEFRTALAADPDQARAQAGLGDALRSQSRFDEAEAYLLRAVELDPVDPLNQIDLGDYHYDRGMRKEGFLADIRADLAEARKRYHTALELGDSVPEPWAMLGVTYLVPGEDPTLALKYLEQAYVWHPSSRAVLGYLAEAHIARGDELTARDFIRRMISLRRDGAPTRSVDEVVEEIRNRRAAASRRLEVSPASGGPP